MGGLRRMSCWILISLVACLTWAYPETQASLTLQIKEAIGRSREVSLSADGDLALIGVPSQPHLRLSGLMALYKRSGSQWESFVTEEHPDGNKGFGRSVRLDTKRKFLIGTEDAMEAEGGDLMGHVLVYKYDDAYKTQLLGRIDPAGPLEKEKRISRFGAYVHTSGDWLLITGFDGLEIYSTAGDNLRHVKTVLLYEIIEKRPAELSYRMEKCVMNERHIVCGVGTELQDPETDNYNPTTIEQVSIPRVLIFSRSGESWELTESYRHEDLVAENDDEFTFPNLLEVRVGLDPDKDTIIVGFPQEHIEEFSLPGDRSNTKFKVGGGHVAIIYRENDAWTTQEVDLQDESLEAFDNFGHSVDCDRNACIACLYGQKTAANSPIDEHHDRCYLIVQDESKAWKIEKTLVNGGEDDYFFGEQGELSFPTAFVASQTSIYVYDDLTVLQQEAGAVQVDQWCFGASSLVTVRKEGRDVVTTMDSVKVGDEILSVDSRGRPVYTKAYLIEHGEDNSQQDVLLIDYVNAQGRTATLTVTKRHLLPVDLGDGFGFKPAEKIRPGSQIEIFDGSHHLRPAVVSDVRRSTGLVRNILTMNNKIIVDGVVATCFAELFRWQWVTSWYILDSVIVLPLKFLYLVGLHDFGSTLRSFAARSLQMI
eukprot:CAMPEP_0198731722 /NCGR_PEP_ID=MMETSP1475-20131203/31704_1 /TAXON_ID= ORGANISM="Unidentified sp., Strain CCMP1999" /NCGR_SAMPLE_ID=MMETSP1475 /ASSEMBLY_ACC=CAM_ASM_001111 /LENGTH=650 /DNA_ID=CAMNT_0044494723 /DNA_START=201 /DNA_END=2153 /DNA_ORIENTATION=-